MSETVNETAGKIVWFEVPAADTQRARGFYGELFGWSFESMDGPTEYHLTYEGGGALAPGEPNGILPYFGTADIDASLARVAELGGTAGTRQEIPDTGSFAVCADSEGNPFGLYQAGN